MSAPARCNTYFFFFFFPPDEKWNFPRSVMSFNFGSCRGIKPGCIPAFYREVYEKICSPTSGNVEREVFKSLLVKSQLSSSVLSQVRPPFFFFLLFHSPCFFHRVAESSQPPSHRERERGESSVRAFNFVISSHAALQVNATSYSYALTPLPYWIAV